MQPGTDLTLAERTIIGDLRRARRSTRARAAVGWAAGIALLGGAGAAARAGSPGAEGPPAAAAKEAKKKAKKGAGAKAAPAAATKDDAKRIAGPAASKGAGSKGVTAPRAGAAAFGVCLEIRPGGEVARVVGSLAARGLPHGAGWYFQARVGAGETATAPCYGAFGRAIDAWKSALPLRTDAELARAGVRVTGHRVVALSAAVKAAAAIRPDPLSLPGSGERAPGAVPDLGRLAEAEIAIDDELLSALGGRGPRTDGSLPPSIGVVGTGKASVFGAPDAWLPPSALAITTLHRFEQVILLGGEFRCDPSAACLYWHRVLYGKKWRDGWVPAGHLVPVGFGAPSADGDRIAYLTPRARLPYTPAPFFSSTKTDPGLADVYDLWLYDADAGALGRVETFSLKAGTPVADLGWDHERALLVRGTAGATVFRAAAHIGSGKKYKKKRKKKPAAPPPKPVVPRV